MPKYYFIQGKIFIHFRRASTLSWGLQKPADSIYFECLIQNQKFNGNFCGLHCHPVDQIRALYTEDDQQKTIIALYNCTQQILHLHLKRRLYPQISWPMLWINILQLSGFLMFFLFGVFSFSAWLNASFQFFTIMSDTLYFTAILVSIILILSLCAPPLLWLLYWPNFRQTNAQIKALQCAISDLQALPASIQNAGIFKMNLNKNR